MTDLRTFPDDARRRAGFELGKVQHGFAPSDWKPLSTVGHGVVELRIHTEIEHRVIYVAKFPEAIYALHAFEEKTRQTRRQDIALAQDRMRELLRDRVHTNRTHRHSVARNRA